MQVVSFGDRPAATIAQLALRKTAEMANDEYAEEKKVVLSSTYMDDIVDSVHDHDVATKRTKKFDEMLAEGSFKIKNWIYSGHKEPPSDIVGLAALSKSFGTLLEFAERCFCFQVENCHQAKIGKRTHQIVPCCRGSQKRWY